MKKRNQEQPPQNEETAEVPFPDVNSLEGIDEIVKRALESEVRKVIFTPGQIAVLKAAKRDEERYLRGEII